MPAQGTITYNMDSQVIFCDIEADTSNVAFNIIDINLDSLVIFTTVDKYGTIYTITVMEGIRIASDKLVTFFIIAPKNRPDFVIFASEFINQTNDGE